MSYRNDHDAALARVDALEHELARLERENATLRAQAQRPVVPAPPKARPRPVSPPPQVPMTVTDTYTNGKAALVIGACALVFGGVLPTLAALRTDDSSGTAFVEQRGDVREEVARCVSTLLPRPLVQRFDHVGYLDIDAATHLFLPCDDSLPRYAGGGPWTTEEQRTIDALLDAENRLHGAIDVILADRVLSEADVPHNTVRLDLLDNYEHALQVRDDLRSRWTELEDQPSRR